MAGQGQVHYDYRTEILISQVESKPTSVVHGSVQRVCTWGEMVHRQPWVSVNLIKLYVNKFSICAFFLRVSLTSQRSLRLKEG